MTAFSKLMEEFSAATGVETVVDADGSCTLESDGLLMTLQYVQETDEVVLFSPVWEPEAEGMQLPAAVMRTALELGYDGKGTGSQEVFCGFSQKA